MSSKASRQMAQTKIAAYLGCAVRQSAAHSDAYVVSVMYIMSLN